MTKRLEEALAKVRELPEAEQDAIAQIVLDELQSESWRETARQQFARVYGPDEPEYSEGDVKPEDRA